MLTAETVRAKIASVKHWYHRMELLPGVTTPGINDAPFFLSLLDLLPSDCRGLRALDLGTRDGYFAFELERRGAEVVAVDYVAAHVTGFAVAAEVLGSQVTFLQDNLYNLSEEKVGTFDIVLFLGLLYHLPDPMGALRLIRTLCRDQLYLETQVIDNGVLMPDGRLTPLAALNTKLIEIPIMQFYLHDALNKDPTNRWAPNMKCMEQMLVQSTFRVRKQTLWGGRGIFQCGVTHDSSLEYHNAISYGTTLPAVN
jgi:tRNA (mo5U34)-methyltransferase